MIGFTELRAFFCFCREKERLRAILFLRRFIGHITGSVPSSLAGEFKKARYLVISYGQRRIDFQTTFSRQKQIIPILWANPSIQSAHSQSVRFRYFRQGKMQKNSRFPQQDIVVSTAFLRRYFSVGWCGCCSEN